MQRQPSESPSVSPVEPNAPVDRFFLNAGLGLNGWWRWVLGVVVILLIWLGIGSIPYYVACVLKEANGLGFDCEGSAMPKFVLSNYVFVVGIIGVWIAVKLFHKKSLTQVVTGRTQFDYNRVLYAIWIGLGIMLLSFLIQVFLFQADVTFRAPNAYEYLALFLFAIVLVPYQAGFEEVFFRGYLLQGFALLTRNKLILALTSGVIFALPHLPNPEPWAYGVAPYVVSLLITGAFYALLTLIDGGIELAVGHHAINNLFITLVANTEVSAIQSPSLFVIPLEGYRLFPDIPAGLITYAVVLAILNWKYKWFNYGWLKAGWLKLRKG